jgi:cysteinyl-tRNA synthetase
MAPVLTALDDDLNTPAAFAALHALAAQVHSEADPSRRAQIAAGLREAGSFLGLLQQDPIAWAHAGAGEVDHIEALVAQRAQARFDRDWSRADELRDQLLEMGVEVEDSGRESRWRMRA